MSAAQDSTILQRMDSVEISLLTCQPRQSVYSLYGHTAIRVEDHSTGADWAVNYGLFSFSKPFFVLRFVFGLTDYEMGIERFSDFRTEYERDGCGVWQQVINLSREDKLAVMEAIDENYRPENRVYRYNYFYDNCTTRARDIIIRNMNGSVTYGSAAAATGCSDGRFSFRSLTYGYNTRHRWARFGNDLLLGVKADRQLSDRQEQFLPWILSKELDQATVRQADGGSRRLVTRSFWAIAPGVQTVESGFPLMPRDCMAIIAGLTLLFCICDIRRRKISWGYDLALMLAAGCAGLILLAMVFSQHPTVSLNLQILLLNPFALFLAYPTIRCLRKAERKRWLTIWPIFICLFLIGAAVQHYAEGMLMLASSLLIRNISVAFVIGKGKADTATREEETQKKSV